MEVDDRNNFSLTSHVGSFHRGYFLFCVNPNAWVSIYILVKSKCMKLCLESVAVANSVSVSLWPQNKTHYWPKVKPVTRCCFSNHRDVNLCLCRPFCHKEPSTEWAILLHFCVSVSLLWNPFGFSVSNSCLPFLSHLSWWTFSVQSFHYLTAHICTSYPGISAPITDCTWVGPLQKSQELALFSAGFEPRAGMGCNITSGLT